MYPKVPQSSSLQNTLKKYTEMQGAAASQQGIFPEEDRSEFMSQMLFH